MVSREKSPAPTHAPPMRAPITPSKRRMLIALANVADRTVSRYLRGLPIQPTSRERIEAAARSLGLL
jgi:hypothetical protein